MKKTYWEQIAEYCEDTFGIYYDRKEKFFICGECDEPIYESDFNKADFHIDEDHPHGFCPICGFSFDDPEIEYTDEEEYEYDEEDYIEEDYINED